MATVRISVRNFQKKIPVRIKTIKKAIHNVFSYEGFSAAANITACVMSDKQIKELNLFYAGRDESTDCLTFDLSKRNKSKELIADIVISADTAVRNSRLYNTTFAFELCLYAIHSTLHLLGYTDNTPALRNKMNKRALKILGNVHT
ncbi:MAG: rRNA maturation RNase YbeY [Candidatus Omnitrophica bacterium]|nr:rRNA maturation RNase YbeY [Candidatus Omnitrophota bacterium]